MVTKNLLFCAGWLLAVNAFAEAKMDKTETINGVTVQSGKKDSVRTYRGFIQKNIPFEINSVKRSIVNFDERCNNTYKDRRKFTDKALECRYHNENLVETMIIKDIHKTGWTKEAGEIERYVLGRKVYNRGDYGFYELVKITEGKNQENQKTITIALQMLTDKETKTYIKPEFEKDSAFDKTVSSYTLTQIGPKETSMNYEYNAETEHWILNKEVSIPQVFASMSKSINDLVKTVDAEASRQSRDIAASN